MVGNELQMRTRFKQKIFKYKNKIEPYQKIYSNVIQHNTTLLNTIEHQEQVNQKNIQSYNTIAINIEKFIIQRDISINIINKAPAIDFEYDNLTNEQVCALFYDINIVLYPNF